MKTRLEEIARSLPAWLLSAALLGILLSAACDSEPRVAEKKQVADEDRAPAFELPAARGGMMSLSQLLDGRKAAALVFYRGFF